MHAKGAWYLHPPCSDGSLVITEGSSQKGHPQPYGSLYNELDHIHTQHRRREQHDHSPSDQGSIAPYEHNVGLCPLQIQRV